MNTLAPVSLAFSCVPGNTLEKVAFLTSRDITSFRLIAHQNAVPVRYDEMLKGGQFGDGWMARKVKARTKHHFDETLRLLDTEANKLLDKHGIRGEFDDHSARIDSGQAEPLRREAFGTDGFPVASPI